MKNIYPIFLKNNRFTAVENSLPQLPKEPKKPEEPKEFKRSLFHKIFLPEDILTYDDQVYQKRLKEYPKKLAKYNQDLSAYQTEVDRLLSKTNVEIFRQERTQEVLSKTVKAINSQDTANIKKGRTEDSFFSLLKKFFGDRIIREIEFNLPNRNSYFPDMAYVDSVSGLCIDIEIDEPYTIVEKEPIHYLGYDDYRNNFFLDNGWFVLRYAEEQIISQPNECINFLSSRVELITGIPQDRVINYFDAPKEIPQWDYTEAKELADRNYRDEGL